MRERLLFIVAIIAFVAIVPLVYYFLFEHGLSVSPTRSITPLAPEGFEVERIHEESMVPTALSLTELVGKVEIRRDGRPWELVEEGMVLGPRDRIRTDPSARAVLSMPGVFSVQLDSGSEFEVKSLTENISKFLLEEGMLFAEVIEDPKRMFEISAASSVTRTSGAHYRISVNRDKLLALGTSQGNVELEASGKVIQVPEGFMTYVVQGKAPEDPIRIPSRLFLKVGWPQKRVFSKKSIAISGQTEKGAMVKIEGVSVVVDSQGKFRKVVELSEGINRLRVQSFNVGGNQSLVESPNYQLDTKSEDFQIRTSPEMWKEKNRKGS